MVIDPQSIAVEGINGEPLSTATLGFIDDSTVVLTQTSGIASAEAFALATASLNLFSSGISVTEEFGTSLVVVTLVSSGLASSENYGNAYGSTNLSSSALASDEAFGITTANLTVSQSGVVADDSVGDSTIEMVLSAGGIQSVETFGVSSADSVYSAYQIQGLDSGEVFELSNTFVTIHNAGLHSSESFGQNVASYDQTLDQNAGLPSEEAFGMSSIVSASIVDRERPHRLWVARRGGSSSSSAAYQVTVSVETVGECFVVCGSSTKLVKDDKATVSGRKLLVSEVDKPKNITVEGEMVGARSKQAIRIRGERIRKAA